MKSLEGKELGRLLNKCWMTHDGMWFLHCLQECGIEMTNKINKAAIRSLAPIETMRLRKAFELGEIDDLEKVRRLFNAAQETFIPDFMEYDLTFLPEDRLRMDVHKCFAHDGIRRIGVIDQYECGIFHRIEAWFSALKIRYEVTPAVERCMFHEEGKCWREYRFLFS